MYKSVFSFKLWVFKNTIDENTSFFDGYLTGFLILFSYLSNDRKDVIKFSRITKKYIRLVDIIFSQLLRHVFVMIQPDQTIVDDWNLICHLFELLDFMLPDQSHQKRTLILFFGVILYPLVIGLWYLCESDLHCLPEHRIRQLNIVVEHLYDCYDRLRKLIPKITTGMNKGARYAQHWIIVVN